MAKERDWIGYANLASNVTQNFQLGHANRTLEGLERAATERRLDEQQQRLKEEGENRLREHIFQIDDNVDGLQRHLRERPCAALALALEMGGILEKNNVSTASFREWEDKVRMKKVLQGLEDVRIKSTALLTAAERGNAEKCAKYRIEMPDLDQLISVQSEKEKFQRTGQKPPGVYNDPVVRDFVRRIEKIEIQRGDLSQDWATPARFEELYAMFGGDLPSEAYESMKKEREAFIKKILGTSDESNAVNDSPPPPEPKTTPKLNKK
jgi:hypothetical protein